MIGSRTADALTWRSNLRPLGVAASTVLPLATIHLVLTWGHIEWPFGDYGVWLHQVERFANGELPYRDFAWQYPPLSLWLVGGLGRILGTELNDVWVITAGLYMAVSLAFAWWVASQVPERWVIIVAPSVFIVGIPFTAIESAPIGMGMYTPAAPLGVLWLLLAGATMVRYHRHPGPVLAAMAGLLAAACLLTKQDFWLPGLVAAGMCTALAVSRGNVGHAITILLALLGGVAAASWAVWTQAGWAALEAIPGGFGIAELFGIGRMLPTWERLVLEGATASLAVSITCGAVVLAGTRRKQVAGLGLSLTVLFVMLAGVFYFMSKQAGDAWPRMALQDELHQRALSLFLPLVAGILLWRNRDRLTDRSELLLLLSLVVFILSARGRRGFERVEGYQILLELPVYAGLGFALWREKAGRAGAILVPVLVGLGIYSYRTFEVGPLTRAGAHPVIATPRGKARFPSGLNFREVEDAVNAAAGDPDTPVFSFGHNGGLSYFLRRPNPAPLTFGFHIGRWDPEEVVRDLRDGPPLVAVYWPIYEGVLVPAPALSLKSWRQTKRLNHYMELDLPYWRQVVAECVVAGRVARFDQPHYEIYAC